MASKDLSIPSSNQLEAVTGDRKGGCSRRIVEKLRTTRAGHPELLKATGYAWDDSADCNSLDVRPLQ